MKKRKIVVITGVVTAGKTTTSYELAKSLPGWIFIDIWKMKEMFEPLNLKDRTFIKSISKKATFSIVRDVVRNMGLNIILQEVGRSSLTKRLAKDLKKHDYKVYSFFLDVDEKDIGKRDIQRDKPTMGLGKDIKEGKWSKYKFIKPNRKDVVINTSHHSIDEVLGIILKTIGEKKKKHPYWKSLRKSW